MIAEDDDEFICDDDSGYPDNNYNYESSPYLINHGGKCCGIKTIYGLSYSPNYVADKLDEVPYNNRAACGAHVWSSLRFFSDAAPKETYGERVERYIKFVERKAPKHLIEVTLESQQYNGMTYARDTYPGWKSFLRKHRFRKVSEFVNSNSGNTVMVFHKYIGQPKRAKVVKDPFAL